MKKRILIIDDEKNIHTTLGRALGLEDFEVESALDGAAGLEAAKRWLPDLILLDLKLPDQTGLEVLETLAPGDEGPVVVMMSGHGTLDTAVKATRLGARDFLEKPVDIDRLILTVQNALELGALGRACGAMQKVIERRHGMVGSSAAMTGLLEGIHRAAPTGAAVLITGPSGAGKELVAKAIHELSRRSSEPFIKLNCGAIAENLVESELFGHERGAFTGADKLYRGRFERAHGGTLFLDEIGEMPAPVQVRLLRVLQEGEIERVGGSAPISVNVRIIAATNRTLSDEVSAGQFREDLYYRLNVIPMAVPPLKDRLEDVPALASYLLGRACEEHELEAKQLSEEAVERLCIHTWPGNVRELAHTVARLAIMTPGTVIERRDVDLTLPGGVPEPVALGAGVPTTGALYPLLEAFEKEVIEQRVAAFDGKVARAAEDLGLERSHLYKKMRQLGISRDS